jgi:mono/diheme cytochrome c family protein
MLRPLFQLSLLMLFGACQPTPPSSEAKQKNSTPVTKRAEKKPTPTSPKDNHKGVKGGTPGDAKAGAAIYAANCVACHQTDGTGMNGVLAADFVNDATRLAKTDEQLLHSITNGVQGKGVMPPQKDILSAQAIADVLAYIRATFGKANKP